MAADIWPSWSHEWGGLNQYTFYHEASYRAMYSENVLLSLPCLRWSEVVSGSPRLWKLAHSCGLWTININRTRIGIIARENSSHIIYPFGANNTKSHTINKCISAAYGVRRPMGHSINVFFSTRGIRDCNFGMCIEKKGSQPRATPWLGQHSIVAAAADTGTPARSSPDMGW